MVRAGTLALFAALAVVAGPFGNEPAATQVAASSTEEGRVLRVGPTRRLKVPSQAAALARDGDTIEIDAGSYRDCAVWRASRLTIRGVGGKAHVHDVSCQGKGIWVVKGSTTTIENIRFSGAAVPDRNGAGIRFEGHVLAVRNSHFNNNQMGILTNNDGRSWLVVSGSTFERNGDCDTFCGHGIYAGHIKGLKVTGSTFTGHRHGHHIKSRAMYSEILGNRIQDGAAGTASFAIDIPNGGTAVIRSNYFQKGPRSENRTAMISIGAEGIKQPSRGILIEGNVFYNKASRSTNFVWSRGAPVRMSGNSFYGDGQRLKVSSAVGR